jgi:hypothetical protein
MKIDPIIAEKIRMHGNAIRNEIGKHCDALRDILNDLEAVVKSNTDADAMVEIDNVCRAIETLDRRVVAMLQRF